MIKPIRASDIKKELPEGVLEVVNQLIQKEWDGHRAILRIPELAKAIAAKLSLSVEEVYKQKLMDVELLYREAGWKVTYESPDWGESFVSYLHFTKNER